MGVGGGGSRHVGVAVMGESPLAARHGKALGLRILQYSLSTLGSCH